MGVLNEGLYRRLCEATGGNVAISNEGEMFLGGRRKSATSTNGDRRVRLRVTNSGEYYRINCPYCREQKKRLWINHKWGVVDEAGSRNLWMAICYNENCLEKADNLQDLFSRLYAGAKGVGWENLAQVASHPSEVQTSVPEPGHLVALTALPPSHPANVYLARRGFDPEEICERFKVSYCDESSFPLVRGRVVIPVYVEGELVGWQARATDEETKPKYWSCPGMKRSRIVYNLETAKRFKTVVICEGPTDVWRYGKNAVALFGKEASRPQLAMLAQELKGKYVVVLLDPKNKGEQGDPHEYTKSLFNKLKDGPLGKKLYQVHLSPGDDPGSKDREWLRSAVRQAIVDENKKRRKGRVRR